MVKKGLIQFIGEFFQIKKIAHNERFFLFYKTLKPCYTGLNQGKRKFVTAKFEKTTWQR